MTTTRQVLLALAVWQGTMIALLVLFPCHFHDPRWAGRCQAAALTLERIDCAYQDPVACALQPDAPWCQCRLLSYVTLFQADNVSVTCPQPPTRCDDALQVALCQQNWLQQLSLSSKVDCWVEDPARVCATLTVEPKFEPCPPGHRAVLIIGIIGIVLGMLFLFWWVHQTYCLPDTTTSSTDSDEEAR